MAGVYWIGANGNTYIKQSGQTGVVNFGTPSELAAKNKIPGINTLAGLRQVPDPNPPPQPAPTNPNASVAAAAPAAPAAPAKVDKSNDIALQNAGLAAVDSQLTTGLGSIDGALSKLTGQYDTEKTRNEGNYTEQSNTNQNNLQKNKQTALVNASQGRQGLFGTLSSLGALNGSGIELANRAVQKGANDDLSGAADAFAGNQSGLDTAIGTFRDEDKARRENASTSADNARINARNDAATKRLAYFGNLVNDYSAQGDEAQAKTYTDQAAALYPEIAKTSVPNANISYSGAAFTPSTLSSYLAGADSTVVNATPTQGGGGLPGLVASPTKRKQLQPA